MDLVIRLPSEAEEERLRRFRVNASYLASINLFLDFEYGQGRPPHAALVAAQRDLAGFRRIQRRPQNEPTKELRRFLTIAWASELQLRLAAASDPNVLGYLNAWTPVHAYYAVYMSLQAWFSTIGFGGIADDHTATLRSISRVVVERDLFPLPWSVACVGCPDLGTAAIVGAPPHANTSDHIEMLATPRHDEFWPRYAKLLETTRTRRLGAIRREWLRQRGRRRMPRAELAAAASRLFPTTLFDFFWRMRIRANYRDVEGFLLAPFEDGSQRAFLGALSAVTDATCLLVQQLVVRQVGGRPYRVVMDEVLSSNPAFGDVGSFLLDRRDLIA